MNLRKRSQPNSFTQPIPKKQKTDPPSPLASLFHSFEVKDVKMMDRSGTFLNIPAQLLLNWFTELRDHDVLDFKLSDSSIFPGFGGLLRLKDVKDNLSPGLLESKLSIIFVKKEKDSVSMFLLAGDKLLMNMYKRKQQVGESFCVCLNEELSLFVLSRLRKPREDRTWANFLNSAKTQYPEISQIEVKNATIKPFVSVEKQTLCASMVYYGMFGYKVYLMKTVVQSNRTLLIVMYDAMGVFIVTFDITDVPLIFNPSDIKEIRRITLPFSPDSLEKINEVLVDMLDTDFKTVSSVLQPFGWKMNYFISGGMSEDSAQYINVCKGPECSFVLVIHSNIAKGEHDFKITKQLQNAKANGKLIVPKLFSGKIMIKSPPIIMFVVEELERKLDGQELRSPDAQREVTKILDELYKNKIHHSKENQENILLAKDGRLVITDFRNAKVGNVRKGEFDTNIWY